MTDPKYCVHVGYAKCGSSLLQQTLFSGDHPEIGVLSPDGAGSEGNYLKSGVDLFVPKLDGGRNIAPFWFDAKRAREGLAASTDGSKPVCVISNEELAGHPFSGGIYAETIARRIKLVTPEAKVLIVFREQRKMLLSAFAHFLERGGARCSLDRYLNSNLQMQIPWHSPTFYCFSKLVSHYQSEFGKDNVLAIPLEVLLGETQSGLQQVTDFLGVSGEVPKLDNRRRNARNYRRYAALRLNPAINLFASRRPSNGNSSCSIPALHRLLRLSTELMLPTFVKNAVIERDLKTIEEHLRPWVEPDNADLQQLVPYDLAALGYM